MKLIKVYKDNCDPCMQMNNFLSDNSIEVSESINIMHNVDVAVKYGIMSVPVLLLVDENEEEITRTFGFKPNEIMRLADSLQS